MIVLAIIIIFAIIYFFICRKDVVGGNTHKPKKDKVDAYAWVTLVMKGNSYIPGALAMAQSLKSINTKHKIVCMVTNDVTDYEDLEQVFDEVVHIDYINIDTTDKSKSNSRYDRWINQSATKWRCLELIKYDKVMFVDSDVVFIKNFDYIFNFKCPAATFFNNWSDKSLCNNDKDIPNDIILNDIKTNYGPLATMILLPTIKNSNFEKWINTHFKVHKDSKSTFDEQTIGEYLIHKGYKWHCIDYKYNYMIGKNHLFSNKSDIPYILHYYNKKPWIEEDDKLKFNYIFWSYLYSVCDNNTQLQKYTDKYKLPRNNIDYCSICKFKGKDYNHKFISKHGVILCNLYN